MSKKTRKSASDRRRKEKRARKEQQQKQYQQWAAEGHNKKSKRSKLSSQRNRTVTTKRHNMTKCDNIGCRQCHPEINTATYATNPNSFLYKRKFMKRALP